MADGYEVESRLSLWRKSGERVEKERRRKGC
jgi:hypothetical protein